MSNPSMRVCAAGLTIAVLSFAAPARAQVVTFTDIRDAEPGKFFDPDPANTRAHPELGTPNTLDIAFENNEFKASTSAPLFTTPIRNAMDTISFNVNAPAGYYVSSIAYYQEGTGTILRVAAAVGASSWVVGGQPANLGFFNHNPSELTRTTTYTNPGPTVVPVSITTGLFVSETLGNATLELTSAKVVVTVAPISDDPSPKKTATIAVSGFTGTYDGDPHGATGTAIGVDGEPLSALLFNLGESFTDAPGGTATWTFSGDTNYNAATGTVAITITPADATIAVFGFTGPYDGASHRATGTATGVDGEPLSALLLNLGESFTDAPGGTANWTFLGDANYNEAVGTAAITINKATPILTWPQPAAITAGTALTATQLNATANVGGVNVLGTFVYEPPLGTVLTATQPLSVAFTPDDAVNYTDATATVTITVTAAVAITVTANPGMQIINPGPQTNTVGDEVRLQLRVTSSSGRSASGNDRRQDGWTAAGLPPGLRMNGDGEIRGRVTTVGTYPVVVTFARNGISVSAQFDWTVRSRSARGGG